MGYDFRITHREGVAWYDISWKWNKKISLRGWTPVHARAETDEAGALRFIKKHGIVKRWAPPELHEKMGEDDDLRPKGPGAK